MNIKLMLIEKERIAYIQGDLSLAKFFDDTLQYVVELEEKVNKKDRALEELYEELNGVNTREKSQSESNQHPA